jgi:hypothetical protein
MMSELLRSVAEGKTPSFPANGQFAEGSFIDEIDRDETASLVYPALKNHPAVPAEVLSRLRRAYEHALMHREIAVQTLEELRHDLCVGGRIAIMQGLAALEHLYPEPWARTMGDIDLYLPDGNEEVACRALEKNGFAACGSYDRVWSRNGIVIDLHVDFWGADRVACRTLVTRGVTVDLIPSRTFPGYLAPTARCAAFHTAFHALKHGFARKRWLFDLLMYFRAGHCNDIMHRSSSLIVPIALDRLVRLGLLSPDESAGVSLPAARRRLLAWALRDGDRVGRGELALALACPTWKATARYLAGSLCPSRRTLREMYGTHAGPVLYAHRFISLFRKAAT